MTSTANYTQIMIAEFEKAQSVILKSSHIDRDQYSELMFRHGSMFAEHFSRHYLNRDEINALLQYDSNAGYWNWWKAKYHLDDVQLIRHGCIGPYGYQCPYEEMKAAMIGDKHLETQLSTLIEPLL